MARARSATVRRRYRRLRQDLDLFRGLGPGDPGYRLRPGASGLDPMESYMEQGRVIGLILKSLWDRRSSGSLLASLSVLFAGTLFITLRLYTPVVSHIRLDPYTVLFVPTAVLLLALLAALISKPAERGSSR